jgi:hypothetical protein
MRADRSSRARKIECHCGTASKLQEAEFEMTKNPWLSLWLSAANTWAGAARGFWTAEMHRQQKALLKEMTGPGRKGRTTTKTRSSKKASTGVKGKSKG